jgi:hypothetical protein
MLEAILAFLADLSRQREEGRLPRPGQVARAACAWWPEVEAGALGRALGHPLAPVTMLWRVLGQGVRGNPLHPRRRDRDGVRLAQDLAGWAKLFNRIMTDLPARVPWPSDGVPASSLEGDGGWCDLCGLCCAHAGTAPHPPDGVEYPAYWYHALAGQTLWPQPFCPFLFQTTERVNFFCGLHPIKPLACRRFDQADCQRGLPNRGLVVSDD